MRNAVTLGVSQNRLGTIRRNFKPFRDFADAHAIVEVIDNRVDRHPRTAQHRLLLIHGTSEVNAPLTATIQMIDALMKAGKPFLIDVTCYFWTDTHEGFGSTPWRHDSQYRGGAITDGGVHHVALLRELLGEVEQLQAFTKLVHPELSGVDTMILNLRFRNGALGRLLFCAGAVCGNTRSASANQCAALAGASRTASSPASRSTAAPTSPSRAERST